MFVLFLPVLGSSCIFFLFNSIKVSFIPSLSIAIIAMLIASLLFIFALSIQYSIVPLIANYIMSLALLMSSLIALYKYYKNNKKAIIIYLLILNIFLVILFTYSFVSQL